jgi:hypothetical protein
MPATRHRRNSFLGARMATRAIRCSKPDCGTLNRVPGYSITKIAKCGKCGARLPELPIIKALQTVYKFRRRTPLILFAAFWVFILAPPAWDWLVMDIGCSVQKEPEHGIYARYAEGIGATSLTIRTTSDSDYFVKLESQPKNVPVMSFFIHGGRPLYATVPTGHFVMKVASGKTWCGENYLFGGATTMQVTGPLAFQSDEEHTITLTASSKGNLSIHQISRSSF